MFLAVFSPDGKTLLSARTRDKTVRLWDLATFKSKMVMEGHEDEVHFVGFGPDGTMASLSKDGVVKQYDNDFMTPTGHTGITFVAGSGYVMADLAGPASGSMKTAPGNNC